MRPLRLAALLMLTLASSALADTTRRTTRQDEALQRWVTECTDGSRAVTRYNAPLNRYRTEVITPPRASRPQAAGRCGGRRRGSWLITRDPT
jgi:hypothetical protein